LAVHVLHQHAHVCYGAGRVVKYTYIVCTQIDFVDKPS